MSSVIDSIKNILRKVAGNQRVPGICEDHSYVKVWSSHADNQRTKPAKMLFMKAILQSKSTETYSGEEINVTDSPPNSPSPFDCQKNKVLADDMERSLKLHLKNDNDGSELENFPIQNYCSSKQRMYREVMEVVNDNTLARMSYSGQPHEFIKRKLTAEKCGRQLRYIFANSFYDLQDTIFWVHKVIMDKGDVTTIASYLSVLQALRLQSPVIVDYIIRSYNGRLKYDYVSQIIRKQWDPSTTVLNQYKPKKIPGTPLLIMCQTGIRNPSKIDKSARFDRWMSNLSAMCKTMLMPMTCDDVENLDKEVNNFIFSLITKVRESKNHFPNRPVILAGWSVGALLASYAALEVVVDAVLCFGFPLTGVNGSCVDSDDPFLESKAPTLFIVGQNSNMCSTDDIEVFRSRMDSVTGLVIVGGSDDLLQVSPQKMIMEGITQEIVDRSILDEISEFLENVLLRPPLTDRSTCNNPIKTSTITELSDDEVTKGESKISRKRTKESSPKPQSCSPAKVTSPKEITSLSTKSRSSPSNPQKKRVRFKLDNTPVKRKVGRPRGSNNRKKICAKPASRVSTQKASRMIKSCPPVSIVSSSPKSSLMPPSASDTSSQIFSKAYQSISPMHIAPSSSKTSLVLSSKKGVSSEVSTAVRNISPMVNVSSLPESSSHPKTSLVSSQKPSPLALKIYPFGNDSIFLHKHLPEEEEEEDTDSAEETENIIESEAVTLTKPETSKSSIISSTDLIPETVSHEKNHTSLLFKQSSAARLCSKATSETIVKPALSSSTESQNVVPVYLTPSTFKMSSPNERSKSGSSLICLRNVSGVDLSDADQNKSKSPRCVPLKARTILVPNKMFKTSPKKFLRILPKNPIPFQTSDAYSNITGSKNNYPSTSHQVVKFLSFPNVDCPNQSSGDYFKLNEVSPPATLMRLNTPVKAQNVKRIQVLQTPTTGSIVRTLEKSAVKLNEPSEAQNVTRIQVLQAPSTGPKLATREETVVKLNAPGEVQNVKRIKVLRARSIGPKVGTREETVEKQIAVKTLHESEGLKATTPVPTKKLGYSVFYAKSGGSVIARAVPPTASATKLRQPILPFTLIKDVQSTMPTKPN